MQQMVNCPSCGAQGAGHQFCTNCGARLPSISQQQAWGVQPTPSAPTVEGRAATPSQYMLMTVAATIFKIIGWVVLVGGTLGSIGVAVLAAQGAMKELTSLLDRGMAILGVGGIAGIGLAVLALVGVTGSILGGLGLLAFADLCNAVISINENTRSQK